MSTIAENPIEKTPRRNVSERATVRVTEELDSLVQQLRRQLWLRGIFLSTGTGLVVLLTLIVVDAIVQPQSAIARFLLWLAGFLLCAETIRRSLWKPLREHCSRLNLAWSLEQRHPQIEERLTSTLQLAARDEARSSAFVEAIATQAQSGMADCSEESLAGRSLRNAIIIATICITAFVLGLLLAPERLIPSLANVLRPWHDRVLPRLTAQVLPGNAEISEGADLEIQVTGLDDNSAVLELLADAATSERVRESHSMVTDPGNRGATFLLQHVEESLTYRVRSGGLYSDIFRITVHPAPVITGLQATMTFPDYTQLAPVTVDLLTPRNPSDAASVPMMMTLPGARVTLTGTANMPISDSAMLRDSNALTGKPAAAEGSQHSWEFEIKSLPADAQSLVQHCSVTMTSDHQVPSEPSRFEIHVARDLPPAVEIQGLNADTLTVRPDQSLEIPFSAVDDFGIQKLELAVRKSAQEPSLAIIPATQPGEPDADVPMRQRNGSTTLDIAALNVKPGEALSVWLKVGDNRIEPLGGTQSSDSKIITLQIAEDAAPVGQQAVQQQHENAQKELRTAIDHLKTAQLNVERLSQSLTAPDEAPSDPESADKAASEAREQIQSAQRALQRMQDRANEQPSPLFQPEMKQAQEVSEQELKKAEQQSSLIPLSDDLQQKQEAAEATAKELEQAIQKLEQIQSDLSQRSKDMELAAQLDELAKQQEKLAQRMKEDQPEAQNATQPQKETPAKPDQPPQDQPAAGEKPSKDVQQQQKQKDIADALQKLAASDEDARSELFQKRAEEASKLAEETQRLQEQQERLNQLKDSRDQPEQKRDEQLMEMIAKEQDSIAQQTRELDQAQKDRQAAKEHEATEEPNPGAAEAPQQPEKSLEEAGRKMDEASKQLRQKNAPQAEEQAQQAANTLKKSQPEDTSDEAAGQKPEAPTPGNDSKADEEMESLTKQQERVRDAIQAVRENRPEDAASKLQEQIAERTEKVRQKADELLQRPTDDEENRETMKAAQEKLQQAAEQTKAATEPQQPKDQQPQNQQPKNEEPKNQEPQNQEPQNQQPQNQQPQNQQPQNQQPQNQQPQNQQPQNQQPQNQQPQDQEPQNQQPQNQEPKNQEPKNQEPKNQEPKNQEPKNQQPQNQQPKDQEPKNQEPQNQEPQNQQPQNQQPQNQQPQNQQPQNQQPQNQQPQNQQPQNQQPQNQQPQNQQPQNQQPKNQEPQNQQPQNQQPQNQQRSKAAKALDEATQALQNVCKSCQNCSQCNKPGSSAGSSGKSGNSSKQANASEGKEVAPRDDGAPKEGGEPKEGGPPKKSDGAPKDNGDKKQLAKAAEKATQTAKKPTPEGAKELSRDLNQLADQAAKKSQFPGRKPSDANSKQADKDGKPDNDGSPKPGEKSAPKNASNGKPGGKSNQPDGATGNAQSSDQLDSAEQLRGPSTSNWTRSRRMLNGSVLDDRDAKVPQEYRGVVEDYFEQLSRIESADRNATTPSSEGGAEKEQENQ